MKKRKKYAKVLLTFVLVVALFTVQGLQIVANTKADLSNPTILVSNYEQFMEAVQNAQDGDVIGITGNIEISGENTIIGSDDKHIYIVRAEEFGVLRVMRNGNLTMKNVTVDGGGKPGQGAMLYVEQGHLTLNNVTLQRCDANYGAIWVNSNGIAEINGCVFDSNVASSGSHIYVSGNAQITNCSFANGYVYNEGGAIYIGSSGTATISSSVICNNTAGLYGGGIYNNGTLVIDNTVIYDNIAPNGSDIANTKTSQFQIDSLDDVRALYEARNIVPKEWALDSNNPNSSFDTTSGTSLMKLVYEVKGEEPPPSTEEPPPSTEEPPPSTEEPPPSTEEPPPSTEEPPPSTEEPPPSTEEPPPSTEEPLPSTEEPPPSTEEPPPSTEEPPPSTEEPPPSTEEPPPSTEEPPPSTEEPPPSTEEPPPSSEQPPSGDNTNSANGNDSAGNSTTDNSKTDNSKTTDSHNSTTNNYYTYNNPANNTNTGKDSTNGKSGSATTNVTVNSTSDTKTADTDTQVKEEDNATPSVQMPDNIKLNLQYVDVVYEMIDGRSNIEISTSTQQQADVSLTSANQPPIESAVVQERSAMQTASAFSDNMSQQESSSVDWYEIIKILLLAALFIVVVPKPKQRVISQNEIVTPKPKKKLKPQNEADVPKPKNKGEKRKKEKE